MCRRSARVLDREVGAEVAAAALRRGRARSARSAAARGAARRRGARGPQRRGSARRRATALGRNSAVTVGSPGRGRRCRRGAGCGGLGERGERGSAAEDEALEQRVRGEPVRAVDAGAGALAGGVEARHACAAVEVGDDRRPSCSARPARRGSARARGRSRARLERAIRVGKRSRSIAPEVEKRRAARGDRPRDDVARRQLVGEALAAARREAARPRRAAPREQERPIRPRAPSDGTGRTRGRRRAAPAR